MVSAKPDCTGQKFGRLTAIGRGHTVTRSGGKVARTWELKCDCDSIIYLVRGDFDRPLNGQKSCGCLGRNRKGNVDNKRRPADKTGQRFGNLVAIEMLPDIREWNASIWKCQCDCGNVVNLNAKRLHKKVRANCGDETRHQFGLVYPPTPSPYPKAAGEVVAKYLNIATCKYRTVNIDSQIEDERMNRLIRAAWIIAYRREQGEELSELFEKRYIWKYLRHAKEAIKARIARQNIPIRRYTRDDLNNKIGTGMTDAIFPRVAESIFEPVDLLPKIVKRFKFKTC